MFKNIIKKVYSIYLERKAEKIKIQKDKIQKEFFDNGQIPWSKGYDIYKKESIINSLTNSEILNQFSTKSLPSKYGYRLDERIVEYPWIFSNLKNEETVFLDAGSTMNYDYLLNLDIIKNKKKYIYTFYPEDKSFNEKKISYVYGDLRSLPFKDDFFEEIVCQSTIEHIDMDNSMYGYDLKSTLNKEGIKKSYQYLKVIDELIRVLNGGGNLLITFPYGKFENHDFFQQFDDEMVHRIKEKMDVTGCVHFTFFKYLPEGWILSNQNDCDEAESYNPHSLKGKKEDFAAHSRSICCVKFTKKEI